MSDAVRLTKKDWLITLGLIFAVFVLLPLLVYGFTSYRSTKIQKNAEEWVRSLPSRDLPEMNELETLLQTETKEITVGYATKTTPTVKASLTPLTAVDYKNDLWNGAEYTKFKQLLPVAASFQKSAVATTSLCQAITKLANSEARLSVQGCSLQVRGTSVNIGLDQSGFHLYDLFNTYPNLNDEELEQLRAQTSDTPTLITSRKNYRQINVLFLLSRNPDVIWSVAFNLKDNGY